MVQNFLIAQYLNGYIFVYLNFCFDLFAVNTDMFGFMSFHFKFHGDLNLNHMMIICVCRKADIFLRVL